MSDHTDRDRLRTELALQIAGELERGIRFWPDDDWNDAALEFLSAAEPPLAAEIPPPTPGPTRTAAAPAPKAPGPTRTAAAPPPRAAASPPGLRPVAETRPVTRPAFGPPPPAVGRATDWQEQLATLGQEASVCTRCGLHATRTHVVFHSGSGEIPLVFVGEAPGADEDAQGEAFVGRAGQLLTKIIAAIGLAREDVYICNVLKCRPPGNRNPLPDEIASCSPYLMKQLEILKPRVICTLGLFATQLLLDSKAPIGRLRGRLFRFRGIPLLPTYHPAALLRSPGLKRTVWEDVQLLRRILDEGPPAGSAPAEDVPAPRRGPARPTSGDLFGA